MGRCIFVVESTTLLLLGSVWNLLDQMAPKDTLHFAERVSCIGVGVEFVDKMGLKDDEPRA